MRSTLRMVALLAAVGASLGCARLTTSDASSTPAYPTRLYVAPGSDAARAAAADPVLAPQLLKIADQPVASWFGDWTPLDQVRGQVAGLVRAAAQAQALPTMVLYAVPHRDCGGQSAGGFTASVYRSWVRQVASGIGSHPALVVLEPDALAQLDCLSSALRRQRIDLLGDAVRTLAANPRTRVYLDAGHSGWTPVAVMAARLRAADVALARGFSLDVANFYPTATEVRYGRAVAARVGGKPFVVDTSRNGLGSDGRWCNPPGRALGSRPTLRTGMRGVDALLWVKPPGASDGVCHPGDPAAGVFWPAYAAGLAQRASW
jgi:endoglucanase